MNDTEVVSVERYSTGSKINLEGIPFDKLTRLVTHDLRAFKHSRGSLPKYSKHDVMRFLADPGRHEKELRDVVKFIYIVSPHFRRLIQYFVGLSDLTYIVSPYRIDTRKASANITNLNYRRTLDLLSRMSIKTQFPRILAVCLREDIFFGLFRTGSDSVTVQQLPSDYCIISSIEDNVCNVAFDFSYFDRYPVELDNYPDEFREKYEMYRKGAYAMVGGRCFVELDAPNAFAVKCTSDILDYAVPPFAGILPEIFDIDTYKAMKMDKTGMDNYAMLAMKIPLENGEWGIDLNKAADFWRNLDSVLPDQIGSVLTPMDIEKISFERSGTKESDTVAEAEQNLFTAAGVSSLLFNNEKASANSLLLSIKADQMLTFGIVKGIQDVVNRFIQYTTYGKKFKVTFLDCSPYNRKELGDELLKAASYGMPTISMYAATQGLEQAELDAMSFLETQVLGLQDMFEPIRNSANTSSDDTESQAGAPQKDIGELTDSGEQSREDGDDW